MKVLPLPASISNVQKCYFPMKYFDEIGAYFNKHVIIKFAGDYCVVKILFRGNLHESFCYIDCSVSTYASVTCNPLFREEVNVSNIVRSDTTLEAKAVRISLIFKTLDKLIEWYKRVNVQQVLSNILKLYVVSCGQNIFLKCLKEYVELGIERITINNIESRGKKCGTLNNVLSKIVSSTNITIDNELTDAILLFKRPRYFGGLEKPYCIITDLITQFRLNRNPFTRRNILLIGPPGCGKRTLISKVASDFNAFIVEINGTEILCPKDGQGRPGEVEENIRHIFGLVKLLSEQLKTKVHVNMGSRAKNGITDGATSGQKVIAPFIILYLSHVELMCPNRKAGIGKGLTGQTTQLLGAIDGLQDLENVLIFASTVRVDDVDQSLRRPGRLEKEVFIGIPSEDERAVMLEKLLGPFVEKYCGPGDSSVAVMAKKAAGLTPGRVPADLALLFESVKRIHLKRKLSEDKNCSESVLDSWMNDFAHCAAKLPISTLVDGPGTLMSNTNQSSLHDQRPSLCSIGGLSSVKKRLVMSVKEPLLHPEAFELLGIRPPRGVLLFGPPGCAKTTLARALAIADLADGEQQVDQSITFLSCSAAELYSPFVGESEKIVVDLFERARAGAPSIVFIDELDALFGSRDGMLKGGVQERVLAALLMEMDGVGRRLIASKAEFQHSEEEQALLDPMGRCPLENSCRDSFSEAFPVVTVIAATNRPDLIDEALLRPGRLDQLVYIPPPNEEARSEILSFYASKIPVSGNKASLMEELAKKTELYSGADLKNLCKEAALQALSEEGFEVQEVKEKYFMRALDSMRPSLSFKQILSYENFTRNKCFE